MARKKKEEDFPREIHLSGISNNDWEEFKEIARENGQSAIGRLRILIREDIERYKNINK